MRAGLDRVVGAFLALLMAAAVANVSWQVLSRFALGSPSSFTDELARHLLVWIGLLGAGHAAGRRLHLALDLLPSLPAPAARAVEVGAQLAVLAFALGVLGWGGLRLVALTVELGQHSAALGIPMGVVYAALPASGLLLAIHAAAALGEALRGDAPGRDPS